MRTTIQITYEDFSNFAYADKEGCYLSQETYKKRVKCWSSTPTLTISKAYR
jgi:hypothetical protein